MPRAIPFAITRSNHVQKSGKTRSSMQRRISVIAERARNLPKRQNLTNYDRLYIIDFYYANCTLYTQTQMVTLLRDAGFATITQPTISRLLDREAFIRDYVKDDPHRLSEKRHPLVTLPEVDAALRLWVIQKLHENIRLTGDIIREKARDFCRLFGSPDDLLSFSNGWLESFKARLGLSSHIFHGEAASAPIQTLPDERLRLLRIICWYRPCDVYNVDETALLFCLVPTRGLALHQMPGVKLDKRRLTYMFCVNMDGSDKRHPLIIGRAKKPHCFGPYQATDLGYYYFWKKKAWMVQSIWTQFLYNLNEDMRHQGRHILLLCDNAPSHKHNQDNYPFVRIEPLAPNLTAHLQPLDGGIIASFKSQYKRQFTQFALNRDRTGLSNMYKIDQLKAMQLAAKAWANVTPQTIQNCWKHVGLVPSHDSFSTSAPPHTYLPPVNHPTYPPQPYFNDPFANLIPMEPEFEQALLQMDIPFYTEHVWTDQEIVDQVIAERTGDFPDEIDHGLVQPYAYPTHYPAYMAHTPVYY